MQVQQYIKDSRNCDLALTPQLLVMANDANQLADYNGKFKLAVNWAKNVLKQMSWKACTKMKVDPRGS